MLADKINSGLSKLFDAKQDVKTMQVELTAKNLELAEAQKVSAELLKEISESTAVAEKEKAKVNVIVEAVTEKADAINLQKEEAEADLAKAQPALGRRARRAGFHQAKRYPKSQGDEEPARPGEARLRLRADLASVPDG